MRTHPLTERPAFATFPRLEVAGADECQCFFVPAGLIAERAEFHAQVITLRNELRIFFQLAQTHRWLRAEAFPKLVTLVEQPRIIRVGPESMVVGGAGFGRVVVNVEVADAEVAPDDGKVRINFCTALPQLNRRRVTAAVVKQIAEIIQRAGIGRIRGDGGFENGNVFQPRREAVVGRQFGGSFEMLQCSLVFTTLLFEPAKSVMHERKCAPALVRQIAPWLCGYLQNLNRFGKQSRSRTIMSQINTDLQIKRSLLVAVRKDTRPPVERVEGERFSKQADGFGYAVKLPQHDDFEIAGTEVVRVKQQRTVQMFERFHPVLAAAINFRQRVITRRHPRLIPTRFVKRIIGFAIAAEMAQCQPKMIKRLAVVGIGVAPRLAFDDVAEMFFRLGKFAALEMPDAKRVVATRIQRIAAQRLAPIKHRRTRRVTILVEVQAGDEQLVVAADFNRRGRLGSGRRHFALHARLRLVGNDFVAG